MREERRKEKSGLYHIIGEGGRSEGGEERRKVGFLPNHQNHQGGCLSEVANVLNENTCYCNSLLLRRKPWSCQRTATDWLTGDCTIRLQNPSLPMS